MTKERSMETMNRDLFMNILQSIEDDLEIKSAMLKGGPISNGKDKQATMKDAFYEKYYQYKNELQQLQEKFAKEHYV